MDTNKIKDGLHSTGKAGINAGLTLGVLIAWIINLLTSTHFALFTDTAITFVVIITVVASAIAYNKVKNETYMLLE